MQIIQSFQIRNRKSGNSKNKPFLKRRNGKVVYTKEQSELIKSLFKENSEIYKRVISLGYVSGEDKIRHLEIKGELIRLKAI